jgi:hypothetical protein
MALLIRKSDWIRRSVLLLTMLISGGNLIFPRVPMLIAVIVLCLVYRRWVIGTRRSMLPVLLLLAVILLVTILRPSGADPQTTLIRYANFIAGLMLLDLYLAAGLALLLKDLQVIVRFMVWQALLTVPLAELFNPLFIPFPVEETPYNTFLGIFNYHVMLEQSNALIRPDGFFYEPGVLQIYLNLFLYVSLFAFGRRLEALLAALAVLLTQSTTGVLIACILLAWFGVTRYINRGSIALRVIKTLVGAVLIGAVVVVAAENFQQKLTGESQGSFLAREYDLVTGFNIIAVHPWLGIGFDYDQYLRTSAALGYSDVDLPERITSDRTNSNGIIQLLYSLGIPLSMPFLVGLFRQRFFPDRMLMGVVLFLAALGEALIFTPFFLMIIFSGLLLAEKADRRLRLPRAHGPLEA